MTADISDIQIFLDAEMVLTGGSGLQLTDFKVKKSDLNVSSHYIKQCFILDKPSWTH